MPQAGLLQGLSANTSGQLFPVPMRPAASWLPAAAAHTACSLAEARGRMTGCEGCRAIPQRCPVAGCNRCSSCLWLGEKVCLPAAAQDPTGALPAACLLPACWLYDAPHAAVGAAGRLRVAAATDARRCSTSRVPVAMPQCSYARPCFSHSCRTAAATLHRLCRGSVGNRWCSIW